MSTKLIMVFLSLCVATVAGCQLALGEDDPDMSGYWIREASVYCGGNVDHHYFPYYLPMGWDFTDNADIKIAHYDNSMMVWGSSIGGRYTPGDNGIYHGQGSKREYSPVDPLNPYTSVRFSKTAEIIDGGDRIVFHETHESAGHDWQCTHSWVRSVSLNDLHRKIAELERRLRDLE